MASVEQNHLKIRGRVGGLSFYKVNGKDIVRKSFGPSSTTIKNNPNYRAVRNNNKEFAGATQMSKLIRIGLGNIGKNYQDVYMASRLTGACRKIISNGQGVFGEREANLKNNKYLLINFPLIKNKGVESICKAAYQLQILKSINQLNIEIPKCSKLDFSGVTSFATHFKLTLIIIPVSPYKYNVTSDKYKPTIPIYNGFSQELTSNPLPINTTHTDLKLSMQLTYINLKKLEMPLTVWFGIQLINKTPDQEINLINDKAMQCIAVL